MGSSPEIRFEISKDLVARRNQDGTVILMKLDESNLFYKIEGLAAVVWSTYVDQPTLAELLGCFAASVHTNIRTFHQDLLKRGLIIESAGAAQPASKVSPRTSAEKSKDSPAQFGGIKEFNLEQIETEVLNESIYLDVFAGSDLRLKKNVAPVREALQKITQLEGITFEWNDDLPPSLGKADDKVHAGLIAQQVASVMPELVRSDKESGYLAVEYNKLTSYLVEAVKDLNQLIITQQSKIEQLEQKLSEKH